MGLISALVILYGVGVVVLFASGRASLLQANLLLSLPIVLALAVVRPEWTILLLVVLPPSLISPIPPLQLVAFMLATLFGFLLQGRLHLGPKSGVYPLIGIIVLAIVIKADTGTEAAAAADTMLKVITYYALLMLVAFHAAANGRMQIDTFLNALLIGLVGAALLQPFVATIRSFEGITVHPFRGQFSYLAVMGFGVTYVRLSLSPLADRRRPGLDAFLMWMFLSLAAIGFNRAAWMACLVIFALVSMWTGRKSFWVVCSLLLVLFLTVPVVGERILPGGNADIGDVDTLARVTTGRSVLWGELWTRGADALPFGQGWGYIWSLTPTEVFGFEGDFVAGGNPFIYAHNDFLYLFLELGIMGFGLLIAYWLRLFHRIRLMSRSQGESDRYGVRVLVPMIIVMFFAELFDAAFAIHAVAERFFVAAGLIFGLYFLAAQRERSEFVSSRPAGINRAISALDG